MHFYYTYRLLYLPYIIRYMLRSTAKWVYKYTDITHFMGVYNTTDLEKKKKRAVGIATYVPRSHLIILNFQRALFLLKRIGHGTTG